MIFLIFASLIWAFSFGLIKTYLVNVDPSLSALIRLLLSFLIFLPFLRLGKLRTSHMYVLKMMLIGVFQCGFMYLFYFMAFKYLQAYEVALMTVMTPLMVSLFFDIQKRKFHATHFLMASLCIIGTLILVYRPGSEINFKLWGFLWAQLSNASFAFGQVAYRHWANSKEFEKCSDAENFSWLYAGGIIPLLFIIPSSYWSQISSLSSTQWAVLVYLGIVASGLGIFLWNLGARKVGSIGVLAVMNNLKIPLVLVVSIFLFGENIHFKTFALGGGIIFLSLLLERFRINLKNDKRTKF